MLVCVTGLSGTGKSSVAACLRDLGHRGVDADEGGISGVCLTADRETLQGRLARRQTNDFGKAPRDVDAVMAWRGVYEARHEAIGATLVDATLPLPAVVDAVLAAASTVP